MQKNPIEEMLNNILSNQPTEWHEKFKESSIKMHIQNAFKEAASCGAFYDKMDNRSFLYGVLIASGLSGSMALQFIETTTFIEKVVHPY